MIFTQHFIAKNTKPTIWLIGSNGQIGQAIYHQLQHYSKLHTSNHQQMDITHFQSILEQADKIQPNIIINTAAYTDVDQAESKPEQAYAVNHIAASHLARIAQQYQATLIHLSTDHVFNGKQQHAYRETDQTQPINTYGASKRAGEIAIQQQCSQHIIIRTSWVFSEYRQNFVKKLITLAQYQSQINIVTDQYSSPTYAKDIAHTIIHLCNQLSLSPSNFEYGIYHYSGSPSVSKFTFAQHILHLAQQYQLLTSMPTLLPITSQQYCSPAKRPNNTRLAHAKIQSIFHISPSNWQKALHQTMKQLTHEYH